MNDAVPRSGEEKRRRMFRGERQTCQRSSRSSERRGDFTRLKRRKLARSPGGCRFADCSPTSSTILRAVAVLSATYTAPEWVGSTMTARILLGSRIGSPWSFLDFRARRRVSVIEFLQGRKIRRANITNMGPEAGVQTSSERSYQDQLKQTCLKKRVQVEGHRGVDKQHKVLIMSREQ